MIRYGTHSPFPTLLKPATSGDPMVDGFVPDDGRVYNLVPSVSDEFNGTALDTTKWWRRYKDNSGTLDHYNNELQRYNDNHVVSSGTLKLTATTNGQTFTAPNGKVFPMFGSQMIRSRTLIKYGYVEARVKLPPGEAVWPAFWVLVQNGYLPEIDIMEYVRNDATEFRNMIHGNLRPGYGWDGRVLWAEANEDTQYCVWKAPPSLSPTYMTDDWHIPSVLWDPSSVTWYLDGQPILQKRLGWRNQSGVDPGGASVIANLAMGDAWPTNNWTVQPSTDPQVFEIDYIRVRQRPDLAFTAVSPV